MKIGEKIRATRKKKKISIRDLEALTKISRKNLSNIELGKSTPTIPTLQKIATALGCSVSDFMV